MVSHDCIRQHLIVDEELRLKLYRDSKGILTIGIGHNIQEKGISLHIAEEIFEEDLADVLRDLTRALPFWTTLDDIRQLVLIDMCFNLGISRLLGFKKFIAATVAGRFEDAANEMTDSEWHREVGIRADRLIAMMRSGKDKY